MSVRVTEEVKSRRVQHGTNPTAELRYIVRGDVVEAEVYQQVASVAPFYFDYQGNGLIFLPRTGIGVPEPIFLNETADHGAWKVTVHYGGANYRLPAGIPGQPGPVVRSFDTTGGSHHITHSLATIAAVAKPGASPTDHKRAIGVTDDRIEGVDIVIPAFAFRLGRRFPASAVDDAFVAKVRAATACVNSKAYGTFAEGELLFSGVVGTQQGCGDWEFYFHFLGEWNRAGIVIGDLEPIDNQGWDYLWIESEKVVEGEGPNKRITQTPIAAYSERVYRRTDFAELPLDE